MADPGITSQSEGRVMLSDTFLDEHKNETGNEIDCFMLTPEAAFENTKMPRKGPGGVFFPRGISINGALSDGAIDYTADSAKINGKEFDDPEPMQEYFTLHAIHQNRFRFIYPRNTTARGIILHQ